MDHIPTLRTNLLNQSKEKWAAHTLKNIILDLSEKHVEDIVPQPEECPSLYFMFWKQKGTGKQEFIKFWTDYFELFEILDEKQSHIVKPVLQSKIGIFQYLTDPTLYKDHEDGVMLQEACQWYFVILSKLIHHDNRSLAKEGLLHLLRLSSVPTKNEVKFLLSFFETTALPLIKEHVGWVLCDAQEYFDTTKLMGQFLSFVFLTRPEASDDIIIARIIQTVLGYIVESDKCLSPAATLFLIESLGHSLAVCDENISTSPEKAAVGLGNCMAYISKTIMQGLTTVDAFIRHKVEIILVNIICKRILTQRTESADWSSVDRNLLSILGSIYFSTLTDTAICDNDMMNWFDATQFSQLYDSDSLLKLTGHQVQGFTRMLWFSWNSQKEEVCNHNHPPDAEGHFPVQWLVETLSMEEQLLTSVVEAISECINYSTTKDDCPSCSTDYAMLLLRSRLDYIFQSVDRTAESFMKEVQYFNVIEVLLKTKVISEPQLCQDLVHSCARFLDNVSSSESASTSSYVKYFLWRILTFPCVSNSVDHNTVLLLFLQDDKIEFLNGSYRIESCTASNVKSLYHRTKLEGLSCYCSNTKCEWNSEILKQLLQRILEDVDKVGLGGSHAATHCVHSLMDAAYLHSDRLTFVTTCSHPDVRELLVEYVNLAWGLAFEMRKTETFWKSIREILLVACSPFCFKMGVFEQITTRIFKEAETIMGLTSVLAESLCKAVTTYWSFIWEELKDENSMNPNLTISKIVQVCLIICISGVPLPKNSRVLFGIWDHLRKLQESRYDEFYENTQFDKQPAARLIALTILQSLLFNLSADGDYQLDRERNALIKEILNFLLVKNDEDVKTRYFGNSVIYRKKLRVLQTLGIFLHVMVEVQQQEILLRLLESLFQESHQPCIRYLTEWIVVRILCKLQNMWEVFFSTSEKYWTKKINYGTSFSSICLLSTRTMDVGTATSLFFDVALSSLTQLMLGHHTTVRSYAQICFQKIYASMLAANSDDVSNLVSKYQLVYSSAQSATQFSSGVIAKMLQALENDFFIQHFDASKHSNKWVIFIYLPQISDVASDEIPTEWSVSNFKMGNNGSETDEIKQLYIKYQHSSWHLRHDQGREFTEEQPEITDRNALQVTTASYNYQKKINPWRTLCPVELLMDDMRDEIVTKKKAAMKDGLIVVASLIDRVPNLGGLCRSCEIFGVSKYVISSLKILEDSQFQSLSVSSHNWLSIQEVPVPELELFLTAYKEKGYTIFAIEQVQESVKLNDFRFPKLSLLLLGNEKFGVPASLLPIVDHCLEIPQVGVIRSLNVHVTGALCIWEYACQHVLS